MMWRIVDEYVGWGDPRKANEWMRAAIGTEFGQQPDGIIVDRHVFGLVVDHRGILLCQDFSVQIASSDDRQATAALDAAGLRFSYVTADGRELSADTLDAHYSRGDYDDQRDYTPNFVSGVEPNEDGPTMWCDCKDNVMPLMARTMIRILIEEARMAGLDSAQIKPSPRITK
jgi:hypothetical protein